MEIIFFILCLRKYLQWEKVNDCLVLVVALSSLLVAISGLPLHFVPWSCSPFTVHVHIISKTEFYTCFFNFLEKMFTHKQNRLSNFLRNYTTNIVWNQSNCESITNIFLAFVIIMAKFFLNLHRNF